MKSLCVATILNLSMVVFSSPVFWDGICVKDSSRRLLPYQNLPNGHDMQSLIPIKCIQACRDKGYSYAGVQTGYQCWCGNQTPSASKIVSNRECNVRCAGDSSIKCGGVWRMNVFTTSA